MTAGYDNDFDFMTPVSDPALVNRLTSSLMDEVAEDESRSRAETITEVRQQYIAASDTAVDLPAGFYNPITGDLVRDAEVRELNGADEEALAKIKNDGKMLLTMLERAVVKIGEEPATPAMLDQLLIGDRDALLLGIRRATFGDDVEVVVTCLSCDLRQEITLSIANDVPVRRHDDASERDLSVQTKQGMVDLTLPTGSTQKKIIAAGERTMAEINTMLLAACVLSVDSAPVLGPDAVRRFGMGDRAKLVDAIVAAAPGPRLEEVKRTCTGCEKDIPLPLALSDLFRP